MNLRELVDRLQKKVDCDIVYGENDSFFDFYTNINWGAAGKKVYKSHEKSISSYKVIKDGFIVTCFCDISGYDYWMKNQCEPNYLTITCSITDKTSVNESEIINAYADCLGHFEALLPDYTHLLIP